MPSHFKIYPIEKLTVSEDTVRTLIARMRRDELPSLVDWRTDFFAVKANSDTKVVANSRIAGLPGLRPVDRAELVDRLYRENILPQIKDYPQYIEGEEKYLPYRFSSRSVKLPYSVIKEGTVYPYFDNVAVDIQLEVQQAFERALLEGTKSIRKLIPLHSLRPLSFEKAADRLPSTTAGGLPFLKAGKVMQGSTVIENNIPEYVKDAEHLAYADLTEQDRLNHAFIAIGRGQESNDKNDTYEGLVTPKQRKPGAEAHGGTILGARLEPGVEARKKDPRRAALVDQQKVDHVIHNALLRLSQTQVILSWDGSSYDTHMIPAGAMAIGDVIIDSFALEEKDKIAFKKYFFHMFHDPLVTPEGILWGEHGMPSGTYMTNELDSCYNEVLSIMFKYLHPEDKRVELEMVTDQGDDAVMILTNSAGLSNEELANLVSERYSQMFMVVNPKKQRISNDSAEYLKRLHTKDRVESYRSYVWTYIGMSNMERAKNGRGDMYSARFIMQAANHYANLPAFDSFMKSVAEGDIVNHIGLNLQGGAHTILQRAGGATNVLKRLGMQAYATHLGVNHTTGEARLAETLSSAGGVSQQND